MPQLRSLLCIGAALLGLAGCNPEDMIKKVASEEDQQGASECIDALRARRFDAIENTLADELKSPETRNKLEQMASLLPAGKPDTIKLVGANINLGGGARTADITYQYTFGKRYFMVNCATSTGITDRHIVGLNVQELEFPIEEQAGFSLKDKTPAQYALLVAAVLFAALTLVALIFCILEKGLRRKWLWIIFILVGFGQLSVYWNAGSWKFTAAHLTLFSAGAVSRGYGGWVVSIGLPVGAAVYLIRRFLNHRAALRSKAG